MPADYDYDYDDYDYYEPTDEQRLAMAIEDDVEDSSGYNPRGMLWGRQQTRWQDAEESMQRRMAQIEQNFDQHQVSRVAQWWDLCSIHDIAAEQMFLPDWSATFSDTKEYEDINMWGGSDTRQLLTKYEVRLDIRALTEQAEYWLYDHFNAGRDAAGLMLHSKNGYYLAEPGMVRMPVWSVMSYRAADQRQVNLEKGLNVGISVMAAHCPPIAGKLACWLPSMAGYKRGVQ